jgi:A/G-specific adenine glycosylase
MAKKPSVKEFRDKIWEYHSKNRRDLPWRRTQDPYKILVSEIMLQQTQVKRVLLKYKSFLKRFPTLKSLAEAPLRDVLIEWQGLGYNRRGSNLKKTAEFIRKEFNGKFPKTFEELIKLPGIGQSTAGALLNFCFNTPTVFIETNIRSVFLYFFFKDSSDVSDTLIREKVEYTLVHTNSREWYYALYDYGTMLKLSKDPATRIIHRVSKHYKKQSRFQGSNRETRSQILKCILASKSALSIEKICEKTGCVKQVILKNLISMEKEGLITNTPKGWKAA